MLAKPFLFWYHRYSVIYNTKILTPCWSQGVSDHKEVRKSMNKYELAVVLSAKLEDEERAAAMEKVTAHGINGVIADGSESQVLERILDQDDIGTFFAAR